MASQPTAPKPSKRELRLRNEAKKFAALTLEKDGICVVPSSDILHSPWTAYIQGPLLTMWESGVFQAEISFPDVYPMLPLMLKFTEGIFHPNIGHDGTICSRLAGDQWSPALNIMSVLIYTRSLLESPNFSAEDRGLGASDADEAQALAEEEAARRQGGQDMPKKLYHYTDPKAIEQIQKIQTLRESAGGIAGPGVYASSLHPTNRTKAQILASNYGGSVTAVSQQVPQMPQMPPIPPQILARHPALATQIATQIAGRPQLSSRADFVIELDVTVLAQEGHTTQKVPAGSGRDVWLITKADGHRPYSIHLNSNNSHIATFETLSSCTLNKEAETLFRKGCDEYRLRVCETIQRYGRALPGVARQSLPGFAAQEPLLPQSTASSSSTSNAAEAPAAQPPAKRKREEAGEAEADQDRDAVEPDDELQRALQLSLQDDVDEDLRRALELSKAEAQVSFPQNRRLRSSS